MLTFRTSTPSPQTAPATGREMSGTSLFCPTIHLPQVRASATGTGHWGLCQEAAGVVGGHTGIQCLLGHLLVGQLRQSTHFTKLGCLICKVGRRHYHNTIAGRPHASFTRAGAEFGGPMHCSSGQPQRGGGDATTGRLQQRWEAGTILLLYRQEAWLREGSDLLSHRTSR